MACGSGGRLAGGMDSGLQDERRAIGSAEQEMRERRLERSFLSAAGFRRRDGGDTRVLADALGGVAVKRQEKSADVCRLRATPACCVQGESEGRSGEGRLDGRGRARRPVSVSVTAATMTVGRASSVGL